MSTRLLRRSLLAFGAILLAVGACGPGNTNPPILDDGVNVRVIAEGPGRITWGPVIACFDDCIWSLPAGEGVTIMANESPGGTFVAWDGDCPTFPQGCSRVFQDGDTVVAKFAVHALRLRLTGDGEGTFRVVGGGIDTDCDASCGVALPGPLQLAIQAQPSPSTDLGDWGGACASAPLDDYCLVQVSGGVDVTKRWVRPPVAFPAGFTMDWETILEVPAPGVLADVDDTPGDTHTAELVSGVTNGSLTLAADGGFSYTPPLEFSGTDGFSYRARDAFGNLSNVATVTITVEQVNRPPVANDIAYEVEAGQPLEIDAPGVLENDTDPDGDTLTAILDTNVAHGTLDLDPDGGFTYTPNDDFTGTDTFTYRASDGELQSEPATVTITVTAVTAESAPEAVDDAYRTTRNTSLTVPAPGVLANDLGSQLQAILATDVAIGSLVLNADGGFSYVPKSGFTGTDWFTYRAYDGLSESNPATVTIEVTAP